MFTVKDSLTEEEIQGGLRAVINDGLATQAVTTLTSGVFLVAFALKLGAPNTMIGLVVAILPLAQLLQLPAIYLVERYRVRKPITVYCTAIAVAFWLLVALIPLLFSPRTGLNILVMALAMNAIFNAISGCSWNTWMRDLVPRNQLGSFFGKRLSLSMALSIVLSLTAGLFIDYWKRLLPRHEIYGYSFLFFGAFLAGLAAVYYLANTPEPRMTSSSEKVGFSQLILLPFRDVNFKNLLIFLGFWNFAAYLVMPFFTVYMLQRLQLDMSLIIALTVLSQIMNLAFLRIWGKVSDLFSNKSVLHLSSILFAACILAWAFTTMPDKHFLTMPLLVIIHIAMGIGIAGINLGTGNIALKLAPSGYATAYLAASNLVISLAMGLGPISGGNFIDFFARHEISWTINWARTNSEPVMQNVRFQYWNFFFFLAFLIGLYSAHRLISVEEVGEVEERIVLNELVAEVSRKVRSLWPMVVKRKG
ncbi:MAG: MFS transporter [bacterium]